MALHILCSIIYVSPLFTANAQEICIKCSAEDGVVYSNVRSIINNRNNKYVSTKFGV